MFRPLRVIARCSSCKICFKSSTGAELWCRDPEKTSAAKLQGLKSHGIYQTVATILYYCIVLYCNVLYCIALHCIVLYCIVLDTDSVDSVARHMA